MSVLPQVSPVARDPRRTGPDRAEPVRVETESSPESGPRLVFAEGWSVTVLASYPLRPDVDLFSVTDAIDFECADCSGRCTATIVAVRDQWLLCPSCYSALGAVRPAPQEPRSPADAPGDTAPERGTEPTAA